MDGVRLAGGGANIFFLAVNAEGTTGGGGERDLFAVELRNEPNIFLVEDTSTSPNFCVYRYQELDRKRVK